MNGPTLVRPETAERLQTLIQLNVDSAKFFNKAADQTKNPAISQFFRVAGEERQGFAAELQSIVCAGGGTSTATGTTVGSLQRWWMGVRGAIADGEEHAMLAETERAEDRIKHGYEHVLKEPMGGPIHEVLITQYKQIKRAHDQVREMRDAGKPVETSQDQAHAHRGGDEYGATNNALDDTAVGMHELDPLAEDAYWREEYVRCAYIPQGLPYAEVQPAYRFGWECAREMPGRRFDEIEPDLRRQWDTRTHPTSLTWDRAKSAVRDAWDRVTGNTSSTIR